MGLVLATVGAGPAWAQVAAPAVAQGAGDVATAAGVTVGELDRLIAALTDDDARAGLLSELTALRDALAVTTAEEAEETGLEDIGFGAEFVAERFATFSAHMAALGDALVAVPDALDRVGEQFEQPAWRNLAWRWVLALALAGVVGAAAFLGVAALLRGTRTRLAVRGAGAEWVLRAAVLAGRLVIDAVPIVALAVGASAALALAEPPAGARVAGLALLQGAVTVLALRAVLLAVLAPKVAGLRLVPLGDAAARTLYRALLRFALLVVGGTFLVAALVPLGLPPALREGLFTLVGLAAAVQLIAGVLRLRSPVAALLRGERDGAPAAARRHGAEASWLGALRRGAAEIWHLLAIVVVVAGFSAWALRIEHGLSFVARAAGLTVLILVVAGLLMRAVLGYARRRIVADRHHDGLVRRYGRLAAAVVRGAIALAALLLILEAWGLRPFAFLATDVGGRIASSAGSIALIVAGAFVLWQVATAAIERRMRTMGERGPVPARTKTVLPLLRSAIFIVLVVVVAMVVLAELGVNIAPLIAGAGVVGLAIGFGSQELVKDVITGLFILFEDQVQVGDTVDVGSGHSGTVEALTVRTLRLRDTAGTVHIVRWANVASVKNLTRDYSYYVFDLGIGYREDTDRVVDIVRALAADYRTDATFGPWILEDLEVLGVDKFQDSAVVIRTRLKTVAGRQWAVGREFNRRLKRRFNETNVEIPFPSMTVYFGSDTGGEATPARVALTAPGLEARLAALAGEGDGGTGEGEAAEGAAAEATAPKPPRRRKPKEGYTAAAGGDDAPESSTGH